MNSFFKLNQSSRKIINRYISIRRIEFHILARSSNFHDLIEISAKLILTIFSIFTAEIKIYQTLNKSQILHDIISPFRDTNRLDEKRDTLSLPLQWIIPFPHFLEEQERSTVLMECKVKKWRVSQIITLVSPGIILPIVQPPSTSRARILLSSTRMTRPRFPSLFALNLGGEFFFSLL